MFLLECDTDLSQCQNQLTRARSTATSGNEARRQNYDEEAVVQSFTSAVGNFLARHAPKVGEGNTTTL